MIHLGRPRKHADQVSKGILGLFDTFPGSNQGDLKVAEAGVQGTASPLAEREVSSLLFLSPPPQAAKKNF